MESLLRSACITLLLLHIIHCEGGYKNSSQGTDVSVLGPNNYNYIVWQRDDYWEFASSDVETSSWPYTTPWYSSTVSPTPSSVAPTPCYEEDFCLNDGVENSICSQLDGETYSCKCEDGYYPEFTDSTQICEELTDWCEIYGYTCVKEFHQQCNSEENKCECMEGYENVSEVTYALKCLMTQQCKDKKCDYKCSMKNDEALCSCPEGWKLTSNEGTTCEKESGFVCSEDSTCIDNDGGYCVSSEDNMCACKADHKLNSDNVCVLDDDESLSCDKNAKWDGEKCVCNVYFTGDGMECTAEDLCKEYEENCLKQNARCIPTYEEYTDGYECVCKMGFVRTEEDDKCEYYEELVIFEGSFSFYSTLTDEQLNANVIPEARHFNSELQSLLSSIYSRYMDTNETVLFSTTVQLHEYSSFGNFKDSDDLEQDINLDASSESLNQDNPPESLLESTLHDVNRDPLQYLEPDVALGHRQTSFQPNFKKDDLSNVGKSSTGLVLVVFHILTTMADASATAIVMWLSDACVGSEEDDTCLLSSTNSTEYSTFCGSSCATFSVSVFPDDSFNGNVHVDGCKQFHEEDILCVPGINICNRHDTQSGKYTCTCKGTTFDEPTVYMHICQDENECHRKACTDPRKTCINLDGSFQCICGKEYTEGENGECLNFCEVHAKEYEDLQCNDEGNAFICPDSKYGLFCNMENDLQMEIQGKKKLIYLLAGILSGLTLAAVIVIAIAAFRLRNMESKSSSFEEEEDDTEASSSSDDDETRKISS